MAGVSVVELLPFVDVRSLPPEVQATLEAVGAALIRGEGIKSIANTSGFRKDWASVRVMELRAAFLAQAAEHVDDMSAGLRARVIEEVAKLPPPRYQRVRARSRCLAGRST